MMLDLLKRVGKLRLLVWLVISTSITFRFWALDHIPGVNGDEAWYGVRANQNLAGIDLPSTTPTGNPINLFYLGPLIFLIGILGNNFWALRLVAFLSGLAAIGLSYIVSQAWMDKKERILFGVMIACLPVNIAYSRFGWDASETVLISLLVIYWAWEKRWKLSLLGVLIAYLIHPTNLFLVPVLMGLNGGDWGRVLVKEKQKINSKKIFLAMGVLGVAIAVLLQTRLGALIPEKRLITQRLTDLNGWLMFSKYFVGLVIGTSTFQYIAGSFLSPWVGYLEVFGGLVSLLALWFTRKNLSLKIKGLVLGLIISLVSFYLIGGLASIMPDYQRFVLWAIAPTVIVLCKIMSVVWKKYFSRFNFSYLAIFLGSLWLFLFAWGYFYPLIFQDKTSHRTFWTGPIEPKLKAFSLVEEAIKNDSVLVLAEDWWIYWPMRYLAGEKAGIKVEFWDKYHIANHQWQKRDMEQFVVVFADSALDKYCQSVSDYSFLGSSYSFSGQTIIESL